MKKTFTSCLLAVCVLNGVMAQSPEVATFEDLNIEAENYWDGSDESAMFASGGYTFVNNYVDWGGYGSWDGFAYASMTAKTYASLADQYNCIMGAGVNGSQTYGVAYYSAFMGTEPTIIANDASVFAAKGCYVTNSAYAYWSMKEGDDYTKKFDESDWFVITATGYLNGEAGNSAEFYLAKDGVIVDSWQYFDLSALGQVDEIHFTLSSSDNGQWGMNTPAYFCMDDFGAENNLVGIKSVEIPSEQGYDLYGRRVNGSLGWQIIGGSITLHK